MHLLQGRRECLLEPKARVKPGHKGGTGARRKIISLVSVSLTCWPSRLGEGVRGPTEQCGSRRPTLRQGRSQRVQSTESRQMWETSESGVSEALRCSLTQFEWRGAHSERSGLSGERLSRAIRLTNTSLSAEARRRFLLSALPLPAPRLRTASRVHVTCCINVWVESCASSILVDRDGL